MSTHPKLSLFAAILININIMFGVGLFINTVELAHRAGPFGWLAYLCIGILILPLIMSIAQLVAWYPHGGFYMYARNALGPIWGFLSGWSFFTAKLASATLMINASVRLIQQVVPLAQIIPTLLLNIIILGFFLLLNLRNMRSGKRIQTVFIFAKAIPILFAILAGAYLWHPSTASFSALSESAFAGLLSALPLVLYATMGFESVCSLSSTIENPTVNGPRAIFGSYAIVILISCLYQGLFYAAAGDALTTAHSYLEAFPALLSRIIDSNSPLFNHLVALLHLAIASSALGGSYGILFSNGWNLRVLAQHGHIAGGKFITQLSPNGVPSRCILIEGIICLIYLAVTYGTAVPLQQLAAFGCTIAYTLSVISVIVRLKRIKSEHMPTWVSWCALGNCLVLLASCLYSFTVNGGMAAVAYILLACLGFWMYLTSAVQADPNDVT